MAQPSFSDKVEAFCRRLTDRRTDGSLAAAKGTAELLRQLITSSRLNTPEVLLAEVKRVGLRIQAAKPIGERWRQRVVPPPVGGGRACLRACLAQHALLVGALLPVALLILAAACRSRSPRFHDAPHPALAPSPLATLFTTCPALQSW